VTDATGRTEELYRLDHIVEIVGRLPHAHEDHLAHRPEAAGEHDLGHDLGAAELADQPVASGHAEDAAHRAAKLGRHAQAVTRQQHTFHHLLIGQRHQQA